jgi:gluconolactonase
MSIQRWSAWSFATTLVFALTAAFVALADDKETHEVAVKDIKLTVPKAWKQEEPSSKLRVAQFKIAAAEGDKEAAELVINQFGGGGGGVDENVKRWVNQFSAKDRKVKVTKGKSSQGEYVVVDATGTYNRPDGPPFAQKTIPVAGQRMLAVMLMTGENGSYFLKLTGSEKTVTGTADDLRKAFGAKAEDEKEQKTE